jgi:type I restriction enzyme R subunit
LQGTENLEEEELAIVDLLTKPDITLSEKEKLAVKNVAKELLSTLKQEKLVLDWRRRQQPKAAVKVAIADIFDQLPESIQLTCMSVSAKRCISTSMSRTQERDAVFTIQRLEEVDKFHSLAH